MNAIKFILREHKKIRKSFATITKATRTLSSKKRMFANLSKFLASHEKMEEKLWYPHLTKSPRLKPIIKHLISEEKSAAQTIKKMKLVKDDEIWQKKLVTLKKDVSNHAKEEETKLFPKVKKLVDEEELELIGKKLQSFRRKHK